MQRGKSRLASECLSPAHVCPVSSDMNAYIPCSLDGTVLAAVLDLTTDTDERGTTPLTVGACTSTYFAEEERDKVFRALYEPN